MNIEFITSYFFPYKGGIETVVEYLASGLAKRGHNICIHTSQSIPNNKQSLPYYEHRNGYLIKRYPIFPFSLFFPKLEYKNSILSLHNYSILVNDYLVNFYPSYKKVLTIYGTATYKNYQRAYPLLSPIYDLMIGNRTLNKVDKVIAMTKYEKNELVKKYNFLKNKVEVIPSGVEIFRGKLQKNKLPYKYFVSVGRITKNKRFDDILLILNDFPEYHFVLAGRDIGWANQLQTLAKKLGVEERYHYLGQITEKDKYSLLANASLFIMSSQSEAFSIASLEGFYYTSKVVGANSGGIIDLYQELGGMIYEVGDISGLKVAISQELDKKMKNDTKKIIRDNYSWPSVVNTYENILLDIP